MHNASFEMFLNDHSRALPACTEWSDESLLHLLPVRHMLSDPSVRFASRGIDAAWRLRDLVRDNVSGFAPHDGGCLFVPMRSPVASWFAADAMHLSARPFNRGDALMKQMGMLLHDYFHLWSYQLMRDLRPELSFGSYAAITEDNLEEHVFCHLITEAVATVGLDYWYLCTLSINALCPIGTATGPVAIPGYHIAQRTEFDRYGVFVQRAEFFEQLATFYCTGEWIGLDVNDLGESPLVLALLRQELAYGQRQRAYGRWWFRHLASLHDDRTKSDPRSALRKDGGIVDCSSKPWMKELMREVGERLWRKVREDVVDAPRSRFERAPAPKRRDIRFTNAAALEDEELSFLRAAASTTDDVVSKHLAVSQFVSRFACERGDTERIGKPLEEAITKSSLKPLEAYFEGRSMLPLAPGHEAHALLLLN